MDMKQTALLLIDLQNDFLHDEGAYGRAQLQLPKSRKLKEQLIKITDNLREAGAWIISAQYTLITDKDHNPIIPETLQKSRPFLTRGDFQIGRWGHQLIDELAPANYTINKITHSAFHMTHLKWLLDYLGVKKLIFAGLVTNAGVASTLRDAQSRGFETILLSDGCAAFSEEIHKNSLKALSYITDVFSIDEFIEQLKISD